MVMPKMNCLLSLFTEQLLALFGFISKRISQNRCLSTYHGSVLQVAG